MLRAGRAPLLRSTRIARADEQHSLTLPFYLATRQILEWHRQRVELVGRLVLAEYRGKIQRVAQASSLLADNPTYGELLASGDVEALRNLAAP